MQKQGFTQLELFVCLCLSPTKTELSSSSIRDPWQEISLLLLLCVCHSDVLPPSPTPPKKITIMIAPQWHWSPSQWQEHFSLSWCNPPFLSRCQVTNEPELVNKSQINATADCLSFGNAWSHLVLGIGSSIEWKERIQCSVACFRWALLFSFLSTWINSLPSQTKLFTSTVCVSTHHFLQPWSTQIPEMLVHCVKQKYKQNAMRKNIKYIVCYCLNWERMGKITVLWLFYTVCNLFWN